MEKQFETMVSKSDLEELGFNRNQATVMVQQCKKYLVQIEGIDFYANRQVRVIPARILEKLFGIQLATVS